MIGLIETVLEILTRAFKSVKYVKNIVRWLIGLWKQFFDERWDVFRNFFLGMKIFQIVRFPSFLGFMTTLILDFFVQNENIKGTYNGDTSSNRWVVTCSSPFSYTTMKDGKRLLTPVQPLIYKLLNIMHNYRRFKSLAMCLFCMMKKKY
jgi:hypothetical protein